MSPRNGKYLILSLKTTTQIGALPHLESMGDWAWRKVRERILHQNGNDPISSGKTELLNEDFEFGFSALGFGAPNTLCTKEFLECLRRFLGRNLAFSSSPNPYNDWVQTRSWATSISLCWPREAYGTSQDTSISREGCHSACGTLLIKFSWSKRRNVFGGLRSWLHFGQYWQAHPWLPPEDATQPAFVFCEYAPKALRTVRIFFAFWTSGILRNLPHVLTHPWRLAYLGMKFLKD